jgi:hypothetical protein
VCLLIAGNVVMLRGRKEAEKTPLPDLLKQPGQGDG